MVIETGAGGNLELLQGDLAKLPVDAIVSPASSTLQGGSGLEGIIFAAAGPGLVAECRTLGGIERGQAKITKGHGLFARHVIHTAGPVWKGGDAGEPETLTACYRNSLQLALDSGLKSIAFPAISTGNFGYPLDEAARVGVREAARFVSAKAGLEKVYFIGFQEDAVEAFRKAMLELTAG
ncbi:MAG: macro domain-containing protein [Verrucomicrobia bacterium]|nr:macro domain-containing protein [Verrucomicrobiota bacterium]